MHHGSCSFREATSLRWIPSSSSSAPGQDNYMQLPFRSSSLMSCAAALSPHHPDIHSEKCTSCCPDLQVGKALLMPLFLGCPLPSKQEVKGACWHPLVVFCIKQGNSLKDHLRRCCMPASAVHSTSQPCRGLCPWIRVTYLISGPSQVSFCI